MEAKGTPTHPFDTNTRNQLNLNCSYSASTTSNNQEWISPFRFLDQPREVRDMVYNSSLSCPESLQTTIGRLKNHQPQTSFERTEDYTKAGSTNISGKIFVRSHTVVQIPFLSSMGLFGNRSVSGLPVLRSSNSDSLTVVPLSYLTLSPTFHSGATFSTASTTALESLRLSTSKIFSPESSSE